MEAGPYSFQAPVSVEYRRSESNSSDVSASSVLSMASASSSSSSCGRISPTTSFGGMRRSTFDLSDFQKTQQPESLRYRGGRSLSNSTASTSSSSSSSSPMRTMCSAHAGAATRALLEMAMHDALSPTMRTRSSSQELKSHGSNSSFSSQHKRTDRRPSSSSLSSNGDHNNCETTRTTNDYDGHRHGNETSPRFLKDLESLVEDLMLGYITFLHIFIIAERHVRGTFQMLRDMVSSWLNAIQFEEPIDRSHMDDTDLIGGHSVRGADKDLGQTTTESSNQQDDQTTSADSTTLQRSDAVRDEWGHFADFQDELADESSFIPSCRVSLNPVARRSSDNKTSLQTLTEIAEDDDADDEDMEEEEEW
eukprot:CAMPEP_0113489560 /NCGR_PEP_ID=MMETSP0014_2-20120614/26591_1 /TAXON_ID=2857 /ORGANISM="Nitzschia sp." /LENGTH=363 /DNA_ID=CAMNT_0000383299 /DNA_START=255 /DNA_END=1343 /DNA_ORIENTATION=+ /assembly_acc=CAM_ASM_000159